MIKIIKCIVLAPFLSFPVAVSAQESHDEWFQCQSDDQCIAKCEVCGDVAINKNYSGHSADVSPACLANRGCASRVGMKAFAKCENNECVIHRTDDK